jgi:hypothetical protein
VAYLAASPHVAGRTGAYFEGGAAQRLSARELNVDHQQQAWRLAADLIDAVPSPLADGD